RAAGSFAGFLLLAGGNHHADALVAAGVAPGLDDFLLEVVVDALAGEGGAGLLEAGVGDQLDDVLVEQVFDGVGAGDHRLVPGLGLLLVVGRGAGADDAADLVAGAHHGDLVGADQNAALAGGDIALVDGETALFLAYGADGLGFGGIVALVGRGRGRAP